MLTVIGDTHAETGHQLEGRTLEAVRDADHVVHVGDFLTTAVYDAIEAETDQLTAVYGNNDEQALREQLPQVATVEWSGLRLVVTHGDRHTDTALAMLARQEDADLVVVGHSHQAAIDSVGEFTRVNPGSYAEPRWYEPAHAEIRANREGYRIRLCQPGGAGRPGESQ
jgi:putative phosphoesterase